MEKFSESSGLGISLEANSGHHYIRSVLPEGPVGRCGKLFSGDELLEVRPRHTQGHVTESFRNCRERLHFFFSFFLLPQVNGISLIGETHKEVVRILKELPLCVYMTCCRPIPLLQPDLETVAPLAEGISATLKLFEVLSWICIATDHFLIFKEIKEACLPIFYLGNLERPLERPSYDTAIQKRWCNMASN